MTDVQVVALMATILISRGGQIDDPVGYARKLLSDAQRRENDAWRESASTSAAPEQWPEVK